MDIVTRLDLYALGRDYITQRATKIDPAQVDIDGSDANIIVGVSSVMADQLMKQLTFRVAALFLDSAENEDLDRYAYDRYNLLRKGASAAVTTCRIRRPSIIAGAGTVPAGTRVVTNTGIEYTTLDDCSLGASDLELVNPVRVRAAQAGKGTQVGVGAIVRFAQPGLLWDKTLQVTNEEPAAGGEDAEDDDTFRARIRDFWRSARRGILAAIEFGAKTVPGIVSAQAIEALTEGALPARVVNLFIADSSGVASSALASYVDSALNEYRAAGIAVLIYTSLPRIVDITLRLKFKANIDTVTLTANIRAAIVEYVNSLPVNGTLEISGLYSVLQRYKEDGLIPDEDSILAPVGDLVPDVGQTIRTTLANVTVA